MRILFLSRWWPYPPNNGSKLRVYNLLRALATQHDISLIAFADAPPTGSDLAELRKWCSSVEAVPWRAFRPGSLRARLAFVSSTPRALVDTFSDEMRRQVAAALASRRPDVIIASQLATAAYAPFFGGGPALLEELELGVQYGQFAGAPNAFRRMRYGLTWLKLRRFLARLLPLFRACTVASEHERRLLQLAAPTYAAIEVLPNFVNLNDYREVQPEPAGERLVFTGWMDYFANRDAIEWFLRDVFPLVRAQRPSVEVCITGGNAAAGLPSMPHVTYLGLVDDIRPVIAGSCVSLAPIRVGGGTRLKVLEAMALNTPVVATTKGAEGLEVLDGEHLLIADDAPRFAAQVLRLLDDRALRARLARNAHRLVEEKYDSPVAARHLNTLLDRIAGHALTGPSRPTVPTHLRMQ